MDGMGRWEPNARGRLEQAAMALFETRGYDARPWRRSRAREPHGTNLLPVFRHKREVLFGGSKDLERFIADAIVNVPPATAPLTRSPRPCRRRASIFEERRSYAESDAASSPLTPSCEDAS